MRASARTAAAIAGAGIALAVLAAPASAHVSPDKKEVPAGGFTAVALTVGHGCEDSPTREVVIQVPDGINNVTPAVIPGWDIAVATEALPEPIEGSHGEEITERESEVTFSARPGSELADGFRQSFTLGFQAPDTPGEHLFFKTIQTCVEGETAWIEEFTGDGEEPEHPSPAVLVTPAEEPADAEPVATEEIAASSDAESDGDGSATGLAVAGLVAGLLGLGAGSAALVRAGRAG